MDIQYDVIIIGAGPAGMSGALYASRSGLKTLMLEVSAPGGKLIKTFNIENYPGIKNSSGVDLAMQMFEHSTTFGATYAYGDVKELIDHGSYKEVVCADKSYTSKAVIIASGTREKSMGLQDEEKFVGRGISYCAVCDGALYRDKDVAVIGGGNSALEEALYLTQFVNKLYLVIRRDVFRADQIIQDKIATNSKIEVIVKHVPKRLLTDDKVLGLVLENVDTKEEKVLDVAGIFPYIGALPNTDFVKNLDILDRNGYVITDEHMKTKIDGIYGAGDVIVKGLRQVVTASNDGAVAAQSIYHYLKG